MRFNVNEVKIDMLSNSMKNMENELRQLETAMNTLQDKNIFSSDIQDPRKQCYSIVLRRDMVVPENKGKK